MTTNVTTNAQTAPLLNVVEGQVKTTSLDVADKFGKLHKDVMRSVRELDCSKSFSERNFAPAEYKDSQGKPRPMFEMTRDGFCFLAMGFTGKEAAVWKEAYITAFNRMETELIKLNRPKVDESERRRLRDQKSKLVKMVTLSKTQFERNQHLSDLAEVCVTLGQPLPNEQEVGVPLPSKKAEPTQQTDLAV